MEDQDHLKALAQNGSLLFFHQVSKLSSLVCEKCLLVKQFPACVGRVNSPAVAICVAAATALPPTGSPPQPGFSIDYSGKC